VKQVLVMNKVGLAGNDAAIRNNHFYYPEKQREAQIKFLAELVFNCVSR
jgi:hypothetical protein